jgi:hypothetical protein
MKEASDGIGGKTFLETRIFLCTKIDIIESTFQSVEDKDTREKGSNVKLYWHKTWTFLLTVQQISRMYNSVLRR